MAGLSGGGGGGDFVSPSTMPLRSEVMRQQPPPGGATSKQVSLVGDWLKGRIETGQGQFRIDIIDRQGNVYTSPQLDGNNEVREFSFPECHITEIRIRETYGSNSGEISVELNETTHKHG